MDELTLFGSDIELMFVAKVFPDILMYSTGGIDIATNG